MPSRDNASNLAFVTALATDTYAANTNGEAVDTQGYDDCTLDLAFGATVDAGATYTIESSPDGSTWTALTPKQKPELNSVLLGPDIPAAITASTRYKYAYVGTDRYVRANIVAPGATEASFTAVLDRANQAPVSSF